MKQTSCSQEEAVASAAGTGSLPEELAAHARQCAVCRDIAQTAGWMRVLAHTLDERDANSKQTRPLPDPGLVWRRARLETEHAKDIGGALEWVQIAFAAAAPIGLAGWVAWNWYPIEAMAAQFLLDTWPQLSSAIYMLATMAPAALTVAALALSYPLLASE